MSYVVSPHAAEWKFGYDAARAGRPCQPPVNLMPTTTRPLSQDPRITARLKAWREGWQAGAEFIRRRNTAPTVQAAHARCRVFENPRDAVTYRHWPLALSIRGARPELTPEQVRRMSAGARDAYHNLLEVDVPLV